MELIYIPLLEDVGGATVKIILIHFWKGSTLKEFTPLWEPIFLFWEDPFMKGGHLQNGFCFPSEKGLPEKERICSQWEQILFFSSWPFSEGTWCASKQMKGHKAASLKNDGKFTKSTKSPYGKECLFLPVLAQITSFLEFAFRNVFAERNCNVS